MNKKLKKILNIDILRIYPKNMKQEDKYDVSRAYLWPLVPLEALYDLLSIIFRIGDEKSRTRKALKLKDNKIALSLYIVLIIIAVVAFSN